MLALISPAKKLDFGGEEVLYTPTQPYFMKKAKQLVNAAKILTKHELAKTMNLSEKLADLNFERFRAFKTPFSHLNAKQAGFVFNGDTYVGLDFKSLTRSNIDFAQKHLRILSGLFGILRPLDLIQPYRLEMGAKLQHKKHSDLYEFWGDSITKSINSELTQHLNKTLVNLASNEYFRVINTRKLVGSLVTPVFKEVKNGESRTIGILAKKARGMMARYIIEEGLTSPDKIKSFKKDGYSYREDLSNETNWIFTRFHK